MENNDRKKNSTFHKCGNKGHIRTDCPNLKRDSSLSGKSNDKRHNNNKRSVTFAAVDGENEDRGGATGFGFCNITNTDSDLDLREMILLDNQSTVDLFCNKNLVQQIWESNNSITVESNGGLLTT